MPKKLPYAEGDCFVLPLRDGGFARGVVARLDGRGVVCGYFFGPTLSAVSEAIVDATVQPEKAALIARFGDLGLLKGAWKLIGRIPDWDRAKWRVPGFLHLDEGGDGGFVRYYDDSMVFTQEERVEVSAVSPNVPRDALLGFGAAEIRLTKLLASASRFGS